MSIALSFLQVTFLVLSHFIITPYSLSSFYICSVAAATTDESGALGACQSKILA